MSPTLEKNDLENNPLPTLIPSFYLHVYIYLAVCIQYMAKGMWPPEHYLSMYGILNMYFSLQVSEVFL